MKLPTQRQLQMVFIVTLVFVSGFALGSHAGITTAQSSTSPETEQLFQPLFEVYDLIQSQYVDPNDNPVVAASLVDGAITGMVDSLGDQFSGYMDPATFPLLNDDLGGSIEGIGVVIHADEETKRISIVNVMEGTPAAESGLQIGDIFVAVNGEDVTTDTQIELASKVRGEAGTEITLTMQRGEEMIDFVITRARINVPNIESRVIEDTNVGYIKLNQFSSDARTQIDTAIQSLDINKRDGLIVDFRGNPGGLLSSAVDVASAFIQDGPILIEDFGAGKEDTLTANGRFSDIQVPIVVLVDESSASASELVAGAMQDTGTATIIGETTLGKGTVQTWRTLTNGGGVRLTIARWLTPNRHWIHELGITPDVVVEWTPKSFDDPNDPQLAAALTHLQMQTNGILDNPEHADILSPD